MATVFRTAHLDITASRAWARIASVDKVHEILPAIIACSVNGEQRTCTFENGGVLQERIISVDSELMRVAYSITDSPFGLEYHNAAMQIVAEGEGTRFDWTTDLKPDRAKTDLQPLFDQLFEQLTTRLAAP